MLTSITLAVLFVFTLMVVSLQALARTNAESLDPFFSNANDFIGQPLSVLQAYGFSCSKTRSDHDSHELRCVSERLSDTFSEIVVIPSEGNVHQIVFTMREDGVQSGHLIWVWGKPEAQSHGHSAYFYWPTQNIVAVASLRARPLSPSLRVYKVYFLGEPMPVVPDNQLTHGPGTVTIWPETTLNQMSSRPSNVQRASGLLRRGYMARDEMDWGVATVNS